MRFSRAAAGAALLGPLPSRPVAFLYIPLTRTGTGRLFPFVLGRAADRDRLRTRDRGLGRFGWRVLSSGPWYSWSSA